MSWDYRHKPKLTIAYLEGELQGMLHAHAMVLYRTDPKVPIFDYIKKIRLKLKRAKLDH